MKRTDLFRLVPALLALALCLPQASAQSFGEFKIPGQNLPEDPDAIGSVDTPEFHTSYLRLGPDTDALLYQPAKPKPGIAFVVTPQNTAMFEMPWGREMARRGYTMLLLDYRGDVLPEAYLPPLSRGIQYLRTLPGIRKVLIFAHSGSAETSLLYDNVAEHGPAACQGPQIIYPCDGKGLAGLAKPDGLVLFDPPLGAFHRMSGNDPAMNINGGNPRNAALDMFSPRNGYDPATGKASYSPDFIKRFYAAQSARYNRLIAQALGRLKAIQTGKSPYRDDEPFVVRGLSSAMLGARLFEPDSSLAAHTAKPHLLLKTDGSEVETIVPSLRPAVGQETYKGLTNLRGFTLNTTVRHFLASYAIRTTPDYAITADGITGVDWHSAYASPPSNAEGVTVPTLIVSASCHYLLVPGEIIYDHLAARDKQFVLAEGANHEFRPCRPEYAAVGRRAFAFVDSWLSKDGRF